MTSQQRHTKNKIKEERRYSLADCEEGRILKPNEFKYPENESNAITEPLPIDKLELFKWHLADETDSNIVKDQSVKLYEKEKVKEIVATQSAIEKSYTSDQWKYQEKELQDSVENVSYAHYYYHNKQINSMAGHSSFSNQPSMCDQINKPGCSSKPVEIVKEDTDSNYTTKPPLPATTITTAAHTHKHLPQLNFKKIKRMLQQSFTVESDGEQSSKTVFNSSKKKSKSKSASSSGRTEKDGIHNSQSTDKDYPHLSSSEVLLLKKGMSCYKSKDYTLALQYYQAGSRLNPTAKEFQYSIFLCEKKISRSEHKRSKAKITSASTEKTTSICWSESDKETKEMLSTRHQYLLQQAEELHAHGDFQGSYNFCERGLQMLPNCKLFQKAQEKAYHGILVSLGIKSASDDFEYKQIVTKLIKVQQFLHNGEYDKGIDQCKYIIQTINNTPVQKLPQRLKLLADSFSIMGKCYLELGNTNKALTCHLHQLDLAIEGDDDSVKSTALANVGQTYAKMKQYEKAITVWKQGFDLGIDHLNDRARLYHDIGNCYMELRDYENTNKYAELSLSAAYAAKQADMKINASLLAAQATLRSGSAQESKIAFGRALYFSIEGGDNEAKSSIESAIREIEAIMKEMPD